MPIQNNLTKKLLYTVVPLLLIAALLSAPSGLRSNVDAATAEDLRKKSSQIQKEIESGNEQIKHLEGQAASLQAALDDIAIKVNDANAKIAATQQAIAVLETRLIETQNELARQKTLLRESMRTLYKRTGVSPVEMMVSSDNFTQFINEQEYLDRLKSAVQKSAEQVVELEKQIAAEKVEQEKLKAQQEVQRNILVDVQRQQQVLLEQTRGEEARYQSLVADRKQQYEENEKQLQAEIARLQAERSRGRLVSQGYVNRGDIVGRMGSTGYSTGPHVHFQVYKNGAVQSPRGFLSTVLGWPVANDGGFVSQEYGCVAEYHYYSQKCSSSRSFHSGLDIADNAGTPLVAAAPGNIVLSGCRGGLGYVVVVDHGDGLETWYPHMITPSGQTYGYC